MAASNKRSELIVFAVISLGFIIWGGAFIYRSSFIAIDGRRYFCLFDDAMISMRYAWNFSHGIGLVWNPGEHVQGYTNLLMTLLMSLATLVFEKSSAVLFIQILGLGFMLAISYVGVKVAGYIIEGDENSTRHQAFVRILSFFGILFYYPLSYWSLMGMETGLLTLLLLLGILSAFAYERSGKLISLFLTSGYLGLAYLTRNELDHFCCAYMVLHYLDHSQQNKRFQKSVSMPASHWSLFHLCDWTIRFSIPLLRRMGAKHLHIETYRNAASGKISQRDGFHQIIPA